MKNNIAAYSHMEIFLGVMLIYVPEFSEPTVTWLPLLTQPAKA